MLLSTISYSCQDDLELSPRTGKVIEGEPAEVQLTVKLTDMTELSRAVMDDGNDNYVSDIWVGMYKFDKDGNFVKRIYSGVTDVSANTEEAEKSYEMTLYLNTESAQYVRIVAVANLSACEGLASINGDAANPTSLEDLLEAADTYDKFEAICAMRPDAKDVNYYVNMFPMSGWFQKDRPGIDATNVPYVAIYPELNKLDPKEDGVIWLQRVMAYNKFIVTSDPYITFNLKTWQVYNVPAGSFLMEQSGNACDEYKGKTAVYNTSNISHSFESEITEGDNYSYTTTGKSFEFFMMENKHTATGYAVNGTDYCGIKTTDSDGNSLTTSEMYNDREREYKAKANSDGYTLNEGVYKSLVSFKDYEAGNLTNNNATYVELTADIDYYILDTPGNRANPDAAEACSPTETEPKIHRTATVTYTIHLGYCEGRDESGNATTATVKDFNCRRNGKYTYNVYVKGVKNIVVEARNDTEAQSGAEGNVEDAYGDVETLDSHYCEFNICLTDEERAHLGYRITAPYNGVDYHYYRMRDPDTNELKDVPVDNDCIDPELYSWVYVKPTTGKDVLATWGTDGECKKATADGLWTLEQLCDPKNYPNNNAEDSDGNKWYTVFIDEYTYTFDDDENGNETSWYKYTNQNDRKVELINNLDKSSDNQSGYTFCKYVFAQKSIQTYYKGVKAGETAIGVEHTDETYCLNYYWDKSQGSDRTGTDSDGNTIYYYDPVNGRFGQYDYMKQHIATGTDKEGNSYPLWSGVIQETVPDYVYGYTNTGAGCSHPEANYPVYLPVTNKGWGYRDYSPSKNDPRGSILANTICMNRNRDLNGDGVIEPDEQRWYLPTSSIYIQIALGQAELPDPLIRFTDYPRDLFGEAVTGTGIGYPETYGTYRFHFITGDYQYFWAEQGVSVGNWPINGDKYNGGKPAECYAARCVRNLGLNPKDTPQEMTAEVGAAYTHNAEDHTFTQDKFTDYTLRGFSNAAIPANDLAETGSRPYYKFEYSSKVVSGSDDYVSFSPGLKIKAGESSWELKNGEWTKSLAINGICGQYTEKNSKYNNKTHGEWRVPTFYELGLMYLEGIPQADNAYFISSTHEYFYSYESFKNKTYRQQFMGYNNYSDRKVLARDIYKDGAGAIRLRCVRDVKD